MGYPGASEKCGCTCHQGEKIEHTTDCCVPCAYCGRDIASSAIDIHMAAHEGREEDLMET